MNQIDFLPKRIRHQRSVYRQLRRQGLTVVLVAAALVLLGYFNEVRIANAQADLTAHRNRLDQLAVELKMLPELSEQLADGQIKRRISRELGSRLTINALLAELGRLLPPAACLTGIECSTIDAIPDTNPRRGRNRDKQQTDDPVATQRRVRLVVKGIAPTAVDVADFIGKLSASPLFTDVKMGYAKTLVLENQNRKARSFQVTFLVAE